MVAGTKKRAYIRRSTMERIGNLLLNITAVAGVLVCVWFVASWANVVTHNLHPGGVELMANWNLFKIFFA